MQPYINPVKKTRLKKMEDDLLKKMEDNLKKMKLEREKNLNEN
jgi:hypothetical protein